MPTSNAIPDPEDWICDFIDRHRMRYRPWDFPEPGSDEDVYFLETWSHALREHRVTEAEADRASIAVGSKPPKYRMDHLPAILRAVEAAREKEAADRAARSASLTIYRVGDVAPASEPIRWPEGVREGDVRALWRHLAARNGEPNIRRVEPERKTS